MFTVGPTTVNAQNVGDLQEAIDSLPNGGRVYVEGVWDGFTTGVEITVNNIEIFGDGIDKAVLRCTRELSRGSKIVSPRPYGFIAVESLVGGVPIENFSIRDLTLDIVVDSTMTPSMKGLMVGITKGARVERIKCVGSYWEFVYHGEWKYNAGDDWVSEDFRVTDCEFDGQGLHSSPINSNNPYLNGCLIKGNYIHDGYGGAILVTGKNTLIEENIVRRVYGRAIAANENHEQNIVISKNILDDIRVYDTPSDTAGIVLYSVAEHDHGGTRVANNVITNLVEWVDPEGELPPRPATGILVEGSVVVAHNTVRGVSGGGGQSASTAIAVRSGGVGAIRPQLLYNTIEASPLNERFHWGIVINSETDIRAIVRGNVVEKNAVLPSPTGISYFDYYGNAKLDDNVFNAVFYDGVANQQNADGSLDNTFINN